MTLLKRLEADDPTSAAVKEGAEHVILAFEGLSADIDNSKPRPTSPRLRSSTVAILFDVPPFF